MSVVGGPNASNATFAYGANAFVYYIPERPPRVAQIVTPAWAGGDPNSGLSGVGGGELVRLLGDNHAPTADLACRFAPRSGGGGGGVVVEATFVSSEETRCLTPSVGVVGSADAVVALTNNATAAASGDGGYAFGASVGGQWSTDGGGETAAEIRLTYVDLAQPPSITSVTPNFADLRGGAALVVRGANLAPTDGLACVFTTPEQPPVRPAALVATAPATFVSGSEVRCIAPASPAAELTHDAQLTLVLQAAGTPSAPLQFTYYDAREPPSILSETPDFADVGYGGMINVGGANFAPTGAGQRLCLFAVESDGALDGSESAAGSESGGGGGGGGGAYRVVSNAVFAYTDDIFCPVPLCDAATQACHGTLRLRISHSGDAPAAWSPDHVPFTFYVAALPPTLLAIAPEDIEGVGSYADLRAPHVLSLSGSNFAPTGVSNALRCRFGESDAAEQTAASFVHAKLVRCSSPYVDADAALAAAAAAASGMTPPSLGLYPLSVSNSAGSGGGGGGGGVGGSAAQHLV